MNTENALEFTEITEGAENAEFAEFAELAPASAEFSSGNGRFNCGSEPPLNTRQGPRLW